MTYTAGYPLTVTGMVSVFHRQYGWFTAQVSSTYPGSATFESANRAIYYPILLPSTAVVRRLWWANGSTVSATYNIDCGIYADAGYKPGVRLVSTGSTAQGTASEVQFVDVTDFSLAPGLYWIAMTCSSTSATFFRAAANGNLIGEVRFNEASALPLPATATPVEALSTQTYLCGFATTASP